ncbi:hypothetical protein DYBT9275_00149 [Dyadobacter sp. CECT 9275]|uniref:Uncharacterized protein n=1 Tax=Dyadobacter helix TaxID=2822344 RepID=A0A916JB13_9BACT|nr:hypothetical protein [Dyadobacter sp. CECT 9275]CAG4988743.1 hypothetical protein DYBT9275_00149 [Dyadobacter sp. CECT 9275]
MKTAIQFAKYLIVFMLLINLPPVSEILSIFLYDTAGIPFYFVSKDARYFSSGDITTIEKSDSYHMYQKNLPKADHKLYRCYRKREWKYLFMWRIYLTKPNWTTPYIDEPFFIDKFYYGFISKPGPYQWNDHTQKWEKVAKK